MAEVQLIRARDNSSLITLVNVAKRLNTAVSGIQADLKTSKTNILSKVRGMFNEDHAAARRLVTNYKLEATKVAKADGVDVEIPDGVVQCQMKVVRKGLSEADLEIARDSGAVAAGLTEVRREVTSLVPQQVLLYLTTHPEKVVVFPCGTSFSIGVHGAEIAEGAIPGMVYADVYYPAEGFLDKVNALSPETRLTVKPFIDLVLSRMLDPTLVFGNRTEAAS